MAAPDDTEPQNRERPAPSEPAEPPAIRRPEPFTDEGDDTEGHAFGTGPSTQGEAMPRIPTDNPHGDR